MMTSKTFIQIVIGLFFIILFYFIFIYLKCNFLSNYYFTVNKTELDITKTTNDSNNLTEHLQVKINTDITSGNYSYSTAIKILDDVAKSPVDTNVS